MLHLYCKNRKRESFLQNICQYDIFIVLLHHKLRLFFNLIYNAVMKKSFYFLLGLAAVLFSACERNTPDQNRLIGVWEDRPEEMMIRSITFNSDGTACYKYIHDTTGVVQFDYYGYEVNYNYSILENDQLLLVASEKQYDPDNKDINYTTTFRVDVDTLVIDSLSLGVYGRVVPLKIGKAK